MGARGMTVTQPSPGPEIAVRADVGADARELRVFHVKHFTAHHHRVRHLDARDLHAKPSGNRVVTVFHVKHAWCAVATRSRVRRVPCGGGVDVGVWSLGGIRPDRRADSRLAQSGVGCHSPSWRAGRPNVPTLSAGTSRWRADERARPAMTAFLSGGCSTSETGARRHKGGTRQVFAMQVRSRSGSERTVGGMRDAELRLGTGYREIPEPLRCWRDARCGMPHARCGLSTVGCGIAST